MIVTLSISCQVGLFAQSSTSFKLEEHQLNSGGHPAAGMVLSSSSFQVSIDSVGDMLVARNLASTSFAMDASFVSGYAPPAEVAFIDFTDPDTLVWDSQGSAVRYNLYRDGVDLLPGGYGACSQQGLTSPMAVDTSVPDLHEAFYYLVTIENRLAEEGSKGFASSGIERGGTTCP